MKQLSDDGDFRALLHCTFCGGPVETRDHCPSRVLLDDPLPENLPVVPACTACNAAFSLDEEYLACLLACVAVGSTNPAEIMRPEAARILHSKPALRARLNAAQLETSGRTQFTPETDRVRAVVQKLAQGHALHEVHEWYPCSPDVLDCIPLAMMDDSSLRAFETPELPNVWPEVGSRAMRRVLTGEDLTHNGWINVQPGVYRYHVSWGSGVEVRIIIGEYLACKVAWND